LAGAAAKAGALLRPFTSATAIVKSAGAFEVVTVAGTVRASDVLIATNGYTGPLWPALRRRIVPLGSYIIATAPLPEAVASRLLPRARVASASKVFLFYSRLSADRRLVLGGRAQFPPATTASTRRAAEILRAGMVRVFPELADVPVD